MALRPLFQSRFATIVTMIGVSVGLGNVWRFPYMMGQYGGSTFLIIYILFTMLFAVPALMAEWALGRETRKGPLGAFYLVFGNRVGKAVGALLLITVLIADSYYLVVISNVAFSSFYSLGYGFEQNNITIYHELLNNGLLQYSITAGILLLSLWIISKGLNKGIANTSKLFVPFFIVILLILIFYVASIHGTTAYLIDFMQPDFSKINRTMIYAALGQSFFSLGLGGTFMLMYGSYMKSNQNITTSAFLTTFGDMGAAIMASLFIVPAVLFFQLDMASGPGLIFNVFPELFKLMPLGRWFGGVFLFGLTMVAFLSNLAALEVIAGSIEELGLLKSSRKKSILILGGIEVILIAPSAFYPEVIGYLDMIFGSGMQTFGGLLAIIGFTWGLSKSKVLNQIFGNDSLFIGKAYYLWTKWVVPIVLFLILIGYLMG